MPKWTKELDDKIFELHAKGVTLTQIARDLGLTKGSVIGRHQRLLKAQKPITVHPTFDPKEGVWFLDEDPKKEAKTIRQLLEKLPPGSTVKDYRAKD